MKYLSSIIILVFIAFSANVKAEIFGLPNTKNNLYENLDTVPQTQAIGHMSTSWEDFKTASPSDNIPYITPPTASVTGDANLEFPLTLPEARNGHAPNLAIAYSIEGGTTWLGTGWNLSLPSFTLDTRWGVPRYDANTESEIYLYNGEQLGPVFHRDDVYPRKEDRKFTLRQETHFNQITRHGDRPNNYWWEVRSKDGSVKYFGGTSATGASTDYTLVTSQGNITEWYLAESRDIYDNLIKYRYQKIIFKGGTAVYPASITYNGNGETEGRYKVDFTLKTRAGNLRNDIVVNCRSGMKYTMADLLDRIDVSYDGQAIRSYRCNYEEGVFLKQLLMSIAQYDQNGELFYNYNFDYHDDPINDDGDYRLFDSPQSWSVPNDDIEVNAITVTDLEPFLETPTILGGAKSWNFGSDFAVTFGFNDGNLISKQNTVGPNGGISTSNGTGVTALVDINGDGLPDKVFKRNGKLFYRANLYSHENKQPWFSNDAIELSGVEDFSLSNTITTNIGAEINLGVGTVGGFIGYSHENSNTIIYNYFADFNGDELIDIVEDRVIKFNTLDANGHPTFSISSANTPSPIGAGVALDESQLGVEENRDSTLNAENPLNDAVRMWRAPKEGSVSITGNVRLTEDTNPETKDLPNKDGVITMIQRNTSELWRQIIPAGDYTDKTPTNVNSVQVARGDSLFFRVHSINNGHSDQVYWDPTITYNATNLERKDANGLAENRYQASEDFMVNGRSATIFPSEGIISISGTLEKPILTDTIYLTLSGGISLDSAIAPSQVWNGDFNIDNISVPSNTEVTFEIKAKSNVDWVAIDWSPVAEYTSYTDGSPVNDSSGKPRFSACPQVYKNSYNTVYNYNQPYVATDTGTVVITAMIYTDVIGTSILEGYLSVKSTSAVDSVKHSKNLVGATLEEVSLSMRVEPGDSIYTDLHLVTNRRPIVPNGLAATATLNGDTTEIEYGRYHTVKDEDQSFGSFYRGWGQFAYSANSPRGFSPILTAGLGIDKDEAASDTLLIDEDSDPDAAGNSTFNNDEAFIVMRSGPKSSAWRGPDSLTFVNAMFISSSRNGMQDLVEEEEPPHGGTERRAINLKTTASSDAVSGGVSAGPGGIGGGYTPGKARSLLDIADMNGDRYPDVLYENSIHYTDYSGGLWDSVYIHNWGTHGSSSEAKGGGVGGSNPNTSSKNSGASAGKGSNKQSSRIRSRGKSSLRGSGNAHETSKGSIGISANFTVDDDWANHTFLDINGDGLEDKLWEGGNVALNLGYTFGSIENWGFDDIRTGTAFDVGGGGGYTFANKSITAGVSLARTANHSQTGFTDVNNDALIDQIISIEPMVVKLNTGHGFSDPITIDATAEMDAGVSIGESINGAGTLCIPIFFFKICFNVAPSLGGGTSSIARSFTDIDGDGYVDLLSAQGDDGDLTVRHSRSKRANLLKSYSTPLGATTELDYTLAGNTKDIPFSKWVLSSLTVNDGVAGDGVDTYRKTISYSNPFYHRHERHFYGYGVVNEFEMDDEENILREIESQYHVRDTYRKGLLKEQSVKDDTGLAHQITTYDYQLVDVENGVVLPPDFSESDDGTAFPALFKKRLTVTEGIADMSVQRIYNYQYDVFGNIIESIDSDQAGTTTKVVNTYDYQPDIYLMDKIERESIFGDDVLYRETVYERDDRGNILQKQDKIDDTTWAFTDMSYDQYGNILSLAKPANHKGERLEYIYKYDEIENQYLEYQLDGYGYEQFYKYEYLYNSMTESTDENKNTTLYNVDTKGRPSTITYPKEVASGQPFTLSYEYIIDSNKSYGLVRHYDEATDGYLFTLEFEDGLFRSIQTKFNSHVYEGSKNNFKYIVSGTDEYDFLARKSASYHPLTQDIGNSTSLYTVTDTVLPTVITYDLFNRPISIIDSYGYPVLYEYGIGNDFSGRPYLTTTITNQRGHTKTEYYNTRGDIVSERLDGPEGDIWKKYEYDGYTQVVKITDTYDNETEYTYDQLGRRTSIKVPDAGLTTLKYDAAGNLLEKLTAQIQDEINIDGSIRYKYDKERLVQIDYPKHFQNKVQIHYGSSQDSFNRAGRIWLQEDATGGLEYFFDENGNANKTIRTVMINKSEIYTYVSEASYDSWGRVLSYTYPDGEELSYSYHPGGQLASMKGMKGSTEEKYLSYIGYDKFLDPILFEYGNETKNEYGYDRKRRLKNRKVSLAQGIKAVDESYTYDGADNLKSRNNTANGAESFGGSNSETYEYDILNRLFSANAEWQGAEEKSYQLLLDYDDIDNLDFKEQSQGSSVEVDSSLNHIFDYQYEYTDQPTRPSTVADRQYKYDANGNLLLSATREEWQDSLGLEFDQNIFDEENRIMGASNNGYISRYTYDAFGRRAVKSHGESQVAFINGAAAGFVEHTENYKANVSPYFVVYKNDYRKHYFADQLRILTKVGTGVFQTTISQGPQLTAGGIDYKSRIHQYENSILEYYGSLGVAPGPPGLLALQGQPEINGSTLPNATSNNPYNTPPTNWPQIAQPDTTGPPGVPIFYEDAGLTRENVTAGYNFTSGAVAREVEQFYYHYDHNGSTNYITDLAGNPKQYAMYFPSGERWIHQTQSLSFSPDITNIMWQGLNFDSETGMYNMGDTYYDPATNVSQNIDPILLHFGESTFLQRKEGALYYDYAISEDNDEDETFDIQILNSEKPSPFTGASINRVKSNNAEKPRRIKYKDIVKAFGGKPGWNATAADVKDTGGPFGRSIAELAPHLALTDITDKVELRKLTRKILVTDKVDKLKQKLKKIFKKKQETRPPPKIETTKRQVQFK